MGNAAGRNSCFQHNFVDNLGDASCLLGPMLCVFDKPAAVNCIGSQSIDSCTIITPIFEKFNPLTEKLFKAEPIVFLVHLGLLLFCDGVLHNHTDYSAAFHLLLPRERVETEDSCSGEKLFYHFRCQR